MLLTWHDRQREWDEAVPSAIAAREQEGAVTKNMNWDVYIESWGDRPEADTKAIELLPLYVVTDALEVSRARS